VERTSSRAGLSPLWTSAFHGARKYLNNVIEQDHRTVKKRVWLAKGYGSFQTAWRTLQGIETVHMIRKGRVRWLAKGDAVGQGLFIAWLFGLAAQPDFDNSQLCSDTNPISKNFATKPQQSASLAVALPARIP
jgi:hypothetical protein